jgi:hypothetical protein
MGKLFLILTALMLAAFAAPQRGVEDPRAFVAQVYEAYRAHPDSPPADSSYVYSERLRALFDSYNSWQRGHDDLVGALDFDWWVNAQDWSLSRLSFVQHDLGPDSPGDRGALDQHRSRGFDSLLLRSPRRALVSRRGGQRPGAGRRRLDSFGPAARAGMKKAGAPRRERPPGPGGTGEA